MNENATGIDELWHVAQEVMAVISSDLGMSIGVLALSFIVLYFVVPKLLRAWRGKE